MPITTTSRGRGRRRDTSVDASAMTGRINSNAIMAGWSLKNGTQSETSLDSPTV